ncbi:hypothetical protein [Pseudonocardia humida]|uniref:Uncharacterized protein n=1 Tax=Pseudonocardia humida TaxID=2800819 RepID=A0ABT1A9K3_9PSEU|nr:hypothetical protein [Pseudonocardia humida]MCO1659615.1 hypothetical protein [Pseudonocardia humida]
MAAVSAVLRGIAYLVVGLLGVVVIGGAAIFGADAWRASNQRPPDCDFLLHNPGGDLLGDADAVGAAWAAVTDPDIDTDGDLAGSAPVLERSCVLWAGTAPAGRTVVFVDTTVAGLRSVSRIVEVRLPAADGGPAERAVVSHSTPLASEFRSGAVLPLSGLYVPPDRDAEVTAVTVLSSADGWQAATPAARAGEGLFDIGVTGDYVEKADDPQDPDALLLLELADGGRVAVAMPVGPERAHPLPVRATYVLSVDGTTPADVAGLRAAGPVLSLMSADARYALIRDRSIRPTHLEVRQTPGAVTLAVNDPQAAILPSFVLPLTPPPPTSFPLLPTG